MQQLKGICKTAIEKRLCLGCNKLELEDFVGQAECKYVKNGIEMCREILKGEQQKI